ncbi:Hypothetical protein RM25_0082 [Propionibacterium freudenreichii subsp. freudenreichii]|nr:Hypothetical protein RM25_0082 [Propionibacterium freudenreichii subsp. freudenreichii]
MRLYSKMAFLGLCVSLLAVGGCSRSHDDNSMDGFQTEAEYNAEAASLAWPPGRSAPSPWHHLETDVHNEKGVGVTDADRQWLCAWEVHYLEDPATRGGSALAELKKFKGLHAYTKAYDVSAKESFDKALGSLELGDAGPLQRDVTVNCMVE